ncbi:MAG TPA: sensor histidine kinase [Actinoplanes sp.]|nr:sensor histidine kinase [Actinoplanes sp.]
MHVAPNVLSTGSRLLGPLVFAGWLATVYPWVWFLIEPPDQRWSALFAPGVLSSTTTRIAVPAAAAAALAGSALLRRSPLLAVVLLLGSIAIPTLAWRQPEIWAPQIVPVDIALAIVAACHPRRVALTAAGLALLLLAAYLTARSLLSLENGTPSEPGMALSLCTAVLLGMMIRQGRERAAEARRQATAELISAERLRIARDLHDMVAHSLGVIALQAGAAGRIMRTQPEAAREAVGNIEKVGRETLAGLRRVVSSLRDVEPVPAGVRTTIPSLSAVDDLVTTTRAAGMEIDVIRLGAPRELPAEIDSTAYRVVQEAISNVIRHAGTDACHVLIDFREADLFVEVVDDGLGHRRRPGPDPGFGLVGMRERVEVLKGTLTAGPRPEGGYRVTACLPIPIGGR